MTVRMERLSHRFGRIKALWDVTIEARPGRITSIIGPNAAGKTTLVRCTIGAIAPTAGQVLIDQRAVRSMRLRELASRMAYVPQRAVVSAAFTVREVIELGRYALPRDRHRVDDALHRLELTDLADRAFSTLSVGQQQRVTLARAMAQVPESGILVLDEPTSAMDLVHTGRCLRLLRSLATNGATVIIVLHDLALVSLLADDVWLLQDGRLAAAGPAGQVLQSDPLERVFGMPFEWVADTAGRRHLLASGLTAK
jgi:iron complex transport system ATP-binding protein